MPAGARFGYRLLAGRALSADAWQASRGRLALAIAGVALGVALGVAVHLINGSALHEFDQASRTLSGDADLVVQGTGEGFAEDLYPKVATAPGVELASPALEQDVRVPGHPSLHVAGIDPFRALAIQPGLLGGGFASLRELLDPDAVVLTRAAATELGLAAGDRLSIQVGTAPVALRVVAVLSPEANAQRMAFADIATAQWRLAKLGTISRIDVRLAPGADPAEVTAAIARLLPAGVEVGDTAAQSRQAEALTRAYRVNLNMLALIALFTGSFLVYATQALTVLQRRGEIAVLRVLGVTRGGVLRVLLAESAAVGTLGAALGIALGQGLAQFALGRFGGDLGAGYFGGLSVRLHDDPAVLAAYFALGVGASVAGCAWPAWRAANTPPAPALKAANASETFESARPAWPGVVLLALAWPLTRLPPIAGLPAGGYAAVALLLAGALWLAPAAAQWLLRPLPAPRRAVGLVAFAQLRGLTSQFNASIAAIVVSFSLMAAMLIMIGSFRASLEEWLHAILPADVYARAGAPGQTGWLDPAVVARITALPGVARSASVRLREVPLEPGRPPITLLARDLDAAQIAALPLLKGAGEPARGGLPPAWVSEPASDLYGWRPGDTIELPLDGARQRFAVAGVWRDYARQNGAVIVARGDYVRLTGDTRTNDLWLWLAPGAKPEALTAAIDGIAGRGGLIDVRNAAAIRAVSLALFDRTFAVTYLLEAVAVLIGLFGISVGFSSQALARRAEFGMLRHVGVTRGQVGAMLAIEGCAAGAIGIACGLATGGAISLVLIHVVNRQSFHWSMDLHVPWLGLALISAVLVAAATGTAVVSGRRAMSGQPIAAVKEDW